MAFQEVEITARAASVSGENKKSGPRVKMTNGKLFVFNLAAMNDIGNIVGKGCTVLYDSESGSVGFRFNKDGKCPVKIGEKTLTVRANIAKILPEWLQSNRWVADVAWNVEGQLWEAKFGVASAGLKRGEAEAYKLAKMSPEQQKTYLAKKAEAAAKRKAKKEQLAA